MNISACFMVTMMVMYAVINCGPGVFTNYKKQKKEIDRLLEMKEEYLARKKMTENK